MPQFEFEVTQTIEVSKSFTIRATDADEAEAELNRRIENGLADAIKVTAPDGWSVEQETTYQER